MSKMTKAQATDLVARLDAGKTLSNKDFERMGFGFEAFLKYGQFTPKYAGMVHDRVRAVAEKIAA
jgi:hypothetical protein